jgi:hypothetical protein
MRVLKPALLQLLFVCLFNYAVGGESCDSPTAAVLGNNHLPAITGSWYWYSFTMPSEANKKLIINSSTNYSFYIWTNTCDNLNFVSFSNRGNLVVTNLMPNQTILISWESLSAGDFDWSLNLEDLSIGNNPTFADMASEGQNNLVSDQKASYWYKFTMPNEGGKHLVINSSVTTTVTILKEFSGNYFPSVVSGQGSATSVFLNASEQVLIRWDNFDGATFSWDLAIEDGLPGENCSNPLTAGEGTNTVASSSENLGNRWFQFTMPNVAKKVVMTLSNNYYFNVYNNCSDQITRMNSNKIVIADLNPGQTILISVGVSHSEIDLNLSLEDLEAGDECQLAKPANEGSNDLSLYRQVNYWYKYTMPDIPGKRLVISSTSQAKVSLYRNTCESLINASSAIESVNLDNLPANEDIFIKWYSVDDDQNFTWNLSVDDGAPGTKCNTALTASLGDNLLPVTIEQGFIYYKFTMPNSSNKKLVITSAAANGILILNNRCDLNSQLASGLGITVGTGLLPNQEVVIAVYSNEGNFEWNLSVQDIEAGDMCSLALRANEGSNELTKANGPTWYTFTMPDANKKLVITSGTSNPVTIYKKNCPYLNQIGYGNGKVAMIDLLPLTQISIKWDLPITENFAWNLSVEDFESGDSYLTAVQATEGINHLPLGNGTKYWYKFTMPDTPGKKLVITTSELSSVALYSTSLTIIAAENGKPGNIASTNVAPGQQVFLSLDSGNDIDWNLSVEDIELGDDCNYAKTASEGANEIPSNHVTSFWYKFTMPNAQNKRLVITSESQNYVYVFADCNINEIQNYISNRRGSVTADHLEPNQEVYIKWTNFDNNQGFSWNLTIDDGGLGLNCTNAQVANEGINIVSGGTPTDYYVWYSFTMPNESGKKLVITSSTSNIVAVHYQSCDDVSYDGNTGNVTGGLGTKWSLKPNQQVFISWFVLDEPEFTWNLSVEDLEQGDACSVPQTAIIGDNHVPDVDKNTVYWYSFQMPDVLGKKLIMTSSIEEIVVVYTGSCDNLNFLDYKNNGNITITGLQPNEMVFISWGAKGVGNFDWNLAMEDELPGESCINPLVAASGNNLALNAPRWFTYIIPKDGNYTVTSVGLTNTDTYLSIYDGCNGTLLGQNDDFKALQSEVTLADLHEGEVIYINWENNYQNNSGDEFTWSISSVKADQTIIFNAIDIKTYGDAPFDLTASSNSGLPIDFSSSDTDVITITGNTATIVGGGSATITASQVGNDNFKPATPVSQTLTVNKKAQTISFTPFTSIALENGAFNVITSASSDLEVVVSTQSNKLTIEGKKITPVNPGQATVKYNQSGNANYSAAPETELTFCINPAKPSISLSENSGAFTLTSSSTEGNQWVKEGMAISGAIHSTFEVTKSGVYTVFVTVETCVSAGSDEKLIVVTEDNTSSNIVLVYPNPVSEELVIELPPDQHVGIVIMDVLGRVMYRTGGTGKTSLKVSDLSSGDYIIQMQSDSSTVIRKFIKK